MRVETARRPRRAPPGRFLFGWLALTTVVSLPGALAPAAADDAPEPHPVLRGFFATGKYVFQGKDGAKAEAPPQPEPKSEPKTEPPPEPKAEPKAEPKPEPKPEPSAEPKAEPKEEPGPEPAAEPKTEPADAPKAEPAGEPSPEVKPAPPPRLTAPNGGPLVGPPPTPPAEPKPEAKPAAEPAADAKPEPKAKPAEKPVPVAAPGVYYSRRAAAYLVIGTPPGLPVLVRTGMGAVESFAADSLLPREDGSVDLRSDVTLKRLGGFKLENADIVIDVPGIAGRLTPPPPLLGWKTGAELLVHTPEYGRDAKACPMDAACVASLRACSNEIRIAVYFGSWCSSCSLLLGRMLRLEHEINGDLEEGGKPAIRFAYYGLPAPPATWNDPEATLRRLDHLPTAIVFVNGAYCTRIGAAELGRPDLALRAVLLGR